MRTESLRKRRAQTFPGLDVVRLGAALLVAFFHLGFYLAPTKVALFSPGWVGVEIFFVISGFVIAFSADGRSVKTFAKSRVARLYPAAFICSTLIVLLRWSPTSLPPNALLLYLKSATLFPIGPWVDNVFWTLPVEMSFYSLVGVALWRNWPLPRVALWLGAYSSAFWAVNLISYVSGAFHFPIMHTAKYSLLLCYYGVFFAFGMLLYARKHLIPALFFLVVALVATTDRSWASTAENGGLPYYVAPMIWMAAIGLIAASVFWNDRLQRFRTRTIGLMTYPLYLIHSSVGILVFGVVPFPYATIIGVGLALIASFAVLPLERIIRRPFIAAPRFVAIAAEP